MALFLCIEELYNFNNKENEEDFSKFILHGYVEWGVPGRWMVFRSVRL